MIRVLVADDQKLIRAGLAATMKAMPGLTLVGEAATGDEVVSVAAMSVPDVILMDIKMPGLSAIDATRQILDVPPECRPKVLMLTTFDLDENAYAAMRAGASGFVLKEARPERLLVAIQAVACGASLVAPAVVRRLVEASRLSNPPQVQSRDVGALTSREADLLCLVAKGLSNADIARRLFLSEATIKSYVSRLMSKLALRSRAQAVVLAYEAGLVTPRTGGLG